MSEIMPEIVYDPDQMSWISRLVSTPSDQIRGFAIVVFRDDDEIEVSSNCGETEPVKALLARGILMLEDQERAM